MLIFFLDFFLKFRLRSTPRPWWLALRPREVLQGRSSRRKKKRIPSLKDHHAQKGGTSTALRDWPAGKPRAANLRHTPVEKSRLAAAEGSLGLKVGLNATNHWKGGGRSTLEKKRHKRQTKCEPCAQNLNCVYFWCILCSKKSKPWFLELLECSDLENMPSVNWIWQTLTKALITAKYPVQSTILQNQIDFREGRIAGIKRQK